MPQRRVHYIFVSLLTAAAATIATGVAKSAVPHCSLCLLRKAHASHLPCQHMGGAPRSEGTICKVLHRIAEHNLTAVLISFPAATATCGESDDEGTPPHLSSDCSADRIVETSMRNVIFHLAHNCLMTSRRRGCIIIKSRCRCRCPCPSLPSILRDDRMRRQLGSRLRAFFAQKRVDKLLNRSSITLPRAARATASLFSAPRHHTVILPQHSKKKPKRRPRIAFRDECTTAILLQRSSDTTLRAFRERPTKSIHSIKRCRAPSRTIRTTSAQHRSHRYDVDIAWR